MTFQFLDEAGTSFRFMYWDESNRLRAVDSSTGTQHYIYDAGGERVLKSSGSASSLYENGTPVSSSVTFSGYTTYPSAFIVVDAAGKYSKHYYAGSQRITSAIGEYGAEIFEQQTQPRFTEPTQTGENSFNADELRQLQIADLTAMLSKNKKTVPAFKKYEPQADNDDDTAQRAPEPGNIYYYHPDHLGTSTYLTDASGQPYQFFINLPFGEIIARRRFIEHQS